MKGRPRYEYTSSYIWTDMDILKSVIRGCVFEKQRILDIACGPNRAIETALELVKPNVRYFAIDIRPEPLILKKKESKGLEGIVADATCTPFVSGSFDIVFYHHAIDDIIETRGKGSLPDFTREGERIVRKGGTLAFSHAILPGDPYTKLAGLEDVRKVWMKKGTMRRIQGNLQDWLIFERR